MDEVAAAVVAGAAVFGFAAFLISMVRKQLRKQRENLEAAAARVGGSLTKSFWKGTALHYAVGDVSAKLTYFMGSDKAPPWTQVQLDWAPPGQLRVSPEGVWAGLRKAFGAQDLVVGDPSFDEAFLIQGTPEPWVREVLGDEARQRLQALRLLGAREGWLGNVGIHLDVTPAGVILKCYRNLVLERELLLAFLEQAEALLRLLRATAGEGPRLSVRAIREAGACPVCADTLEARPRSCRSCGTRYHEECWSYLGGCAIFGCGDMYRGRSRAPGKRA